MLINKQWLIDNNACLEDALFVLEKGIEYDGKQLIKLLLVENKLSFANWLIVRLLSDEQAIKYAINAAESALLIFENAYPNNEYPRQALSAAKAKLDSSSEISDDAINKASNDANDAAKGADIIVGRHAAEACNYAAATACTRNVQYSAITAIHASKAMGTTMRLYIVYGLSLLNE